MNLFEDHSVVKTVTSEDMQNYIIKRLKSIFPAVASNPKVFVNERNSPLFLFCFAISNSSPRAQQLALKIAEYILGKKR